MKKLAAYRKQFGVILISVLGLASFIWTGIRHDWWLASVVVLTIAITATLFPIVFSFIRLADLNPTGEWFNSAKQLGDEQERVVEHYSRIEGTLRFWKSKAAAHYRLHLARIVWSLISAVSLPVLVQRFDKTNPWSVLFMTMFTSWTGLIVALAYTFKSEEKYQGFRQQESDFYDACRQLLDFAEEDTVKLKIQVDKYINDVNTIRKVGRRVETSSPPSAL